MSEIRGDAPSRASCRIDEAQPQAPLREPDEITEDALLTRAKALIVKNGWRPGDQFSAHSVSRLLVAFGLDLTRNPEKARCAYPACGCDFDAVCDAALAAGQDLDGQSQGRLVNYDLPPSKPDQGEVERVARIIAEFMYGKGFNPFVRDRECARAIILSRSTTLGRTEDE